MAGLAVACILAVATPSSVPDSASACGPDARVAGVPVPFSPAASSAFTSFAFYPRKRPGSPVGVVREGVTGREVMQAVYASRRRALCALIASNGTATSLIRQAVDAGVSVGDLGVDASALLASPPADMNGTATAAADAVLSWPPLRAVREAYFADAQPWAQIVSEPRILTFLARDKNVHALPSFPFVDAAWRLDTPARMPHPTVLDAALGPSAEARRLYDGLSRDGFVRVPRWRGLDIARLAEVGARALDAKRADNAQSEHGWRPVYTARDDELPELLMPFLADEAVVRAVSAYLDPTPPRPRVRGGACAYGYSLLRLEHNMSARARRSYLSSHWHHDRAGRRLKLFIFLHDVDPARGRPTVVARGSHNTVWYSMRSAWLDTRFAHEWIESGKSGHEVVRLGGPRGGGFLFDTNALHKGEQVGELARDVLIVEIDKPGRCKALCSGLGSFPKKAFITACPSGGMARTAHQRSTTSTAGRPVIQPCH